MKSQDPCSKLDPRTNIKVLKKIYALYDEALEKVNAVCKKGCASCCTCNVTLTSIEATYLAGSLNSKAKTGLKENIEAAFPKKRYIPKMTTNRFARWCMEGKEIPEEENDPAWGSCPGLKEEMCTLYDGRPFGCRALMSQHDCAKHGYAQVPEVVLTLNNVFMQVIEHVDQKGISGNFADMMLLFLSQRMPESLQKLANQNGDNRFVLNEKIPVLMVPPEHRKQLAPLLEKLSKII